MISVKNNIEFIEVDAKETIDPILLSKLMNEEITGILVKNFLHKDELEIVRKGIQNIHSQSKYSINEGFSTFPISFAQFTQMAKAGLMTIDDYIALANKTLQSEKEDLGISLSKKLYDYLLKHQLFKQVSPIIEPKTNSSLISFNVRELFPGNGELVAHCENLFFKEFPDFFEWLKLMDIKDNKLSYFITIQKPDSGGELCCYDFNWSDVKTRITHTVLQDEKGQQINVNDENLKRHLINPNEGDLLIFAGGNVWHKVLTVNGSKSRITYGGFIAETNKEGKYYVWS